MKEIILWLDQLSKEDIPRVGGKGANLGELFQAGFPVPRAFCITASSYKKQLEQSPIAGGLAARLANFSGDYEALSTSVKDLFITTPILPEIEAEIREAYRSLGREARVAVRSSATAEDLPEASFAGQQETFLGVRGDEALLQRVRECWASLWSARSIQYREKQGFSHAEVALSVVVQEMVMAEAAGVMFTVNPMSKAYHDMIITASYGLGEAVVSGQVTPDTYTVTKEPLVITGKEVARKETMVIQQEQGSTAVSVPMDQQVCPCLADSKVLEIARIGLQIEHHYGNPQDIEWALTGDKIYILQSRPVTTLNQAWDPVQLPGLKDKVYGWVYLGRVPRFLRPRLIPTMVDHFPNPLRPFDIATGITAAMSGVRRVAGDLGIRMPTDVMRPHPSGLILMNPPVPFIPQVLLRLPGAWSKLKRWTWYDPLREWQEVDEPFLRNALSAVPTQDLPPSDILDAIRRICSVITETHYRRFRKYMAPGFVSHRRLTALLHKVDQSRTEELKQKLTQGLEYKTAVINRETKALARFAAGIPAVKGILSTKPFGEMYPAIMANERCMEFTAELNRFLTKYGSRTTTMEPQPSYPTWREEPDHVLSLVGAMLRDPGSIIDDEQAKEDDYQKVRNDILKSFANHLELVKAFDQAVDTMRGFIIAREATLFFFEECVAQIRGLTERLARFLVAEGKLKQFEELYYLLPDELEALIAGERVNELDKLARKRQKVWMQMEAAWGFSTNEKSKGVELLRGTGASRGVVVGTVKVIRGPHQFHKLNPGDVLVCPSTNPAWTPLFSMASAVVAETGSVLSHAAIVAREYGVPAVMACGYATQTLVDGERVEVDGSTGIVRRMK